MVIVDFIRSGSEDWLGEKGVCVQDIHSGMGGEEFGNLKSRGRKYRRLFQEVSLWKKGGM